jgi:Tn3 transposase DDE domain
MATANRRLGAPPLAQAGEGGVPPANVHLPSLATWQRPGSPQLATPVDEIGGRTFRQPYREGMEDQLGALGLVLNVLVLWTTLYMDRALAQLRAQGAILDDQDVATSRCLRLSPAVSSALARSCGVR